MLSIFKPAPHKARLPAAEIDPTYRRLRWQIFLGIFFGYAAYYLVRKNFALAMPYLVEQGFSRGDLGFALSGISIAYGFSKFIMGSVSDRSNPRVFLPAGLILAAAVMLFMGFVPWATSSIAVMLCCCSSAVGSRGWDGRRAVVLWCTGGRRKNVAALCQYGTVRTTSVVVFRRCCSCWGWPGSMTGTPRSICPHSAPFWWHCSPLR